jgi:TonB family protein
MTKCPFCAEQIQDDAVKCRYCSEMFTAPQAGEDEEPQDESPSSHASLPPIFWLGVLGGVGGLGYLASHYFGIGNTTSGDKAVVATGIFAVVSPALWIIGDWLRGFASPSMYFGSGFKRFFWTYGPQLIALGGTAFALILYIEKTSSVILESGATQVLDASKRGGLSAPRKSVAQPQQTAKVKVTDMPHVPDVSPEPVAEIPQRSSESDDLNRELEEELRKIKLFQPAAKLDIPKDVSPSEVSTKPVPQQEVNVPAVKTPETTLKISGTAESTPYWARVQSIITSHWEPPPIDMTGQTFTVIVKFRVERDGTIKDVVVQQSSGNAFYDMAGQRAVLRPRALPRFPPEITDAYEDVEMEFRVEESVG